MKCESTDCVNKAKFVVADYQQKTESKTLGVCGLHLQWGMRTVRQNFALFLVGMIDPEETL